MGKIVLSKKELRSIVSVLSKAKDKDVNQFSGALIGAGQFVEVVSFNSKRFVNEFVAVEHEADSSFFIGFSNADFIAKFSKLCSAMGAKELLELEHSKGSEYFSFSIGDFNGIMPVFDGEGIVENLKSQNHVVLEVKASDLNGVDFGFNRISIADGVLTITDTKRMAILNGVDCSGIDGDIGFIASMSYGNAAHNLGKPYRGGFKILGTAGNYRLETEKGNIDFTECGAMDIKHLISKKDIGAEIVLSADDKSLLLKRVGLIDSKGELLFENGALKYIERSGYGSFEETMVIELTDSKIVGSGNNDGREVEYFSIGLYADTIETLAKSKHTLKLRVVDDEIRNNMPIMIGDSYIALPYLIVDEQGRFALDHAAKIA